MDDLKTYKLGSLFDGSGGFPLAGALCGIEPAWASEVEPYPIAVTRSLFPKMKHLGDISKINGAEVEPVDIITFGSPCQDLSVAGKRAGLKHEANGDEETTRSGLFMEAVRIIKEMRKATNGKYPRFAIWENVPGAFSSNKGEDFRIVCEELIKIVEPSAFMPPVPKNGWNYADSYTGDGWSLAYRVFDAQYWGVPQRRRRIYLVADFRGECARAVLFEREGLRGYFTEGRTPWQTTPANAPGGSGADDREGDGGEQGRQLDAVALKYLFENHGQDSRYQGPLDVCPMLSAQLGTGGNNQPLVMEPFCKASRARTPDDATTWKHATVANCLNTFDTGEARANELVVTYGLDRASFNQGQNAKYDFTITEEQQPTLTARGPGAVTHNHIVRRLTPTECARLQGFADWWSIVEKKDTLTDEEFRFWLEVRNTHARINGKKEQDYTVKQMLTWYNKLWTDSAEYKMWGNGIALPTALYCVQGIAEALEKTAPDEDDDWMN